MMNEARRAIAAEFLGTAALLAVVAGSGIMAQNLSPDNAGVALLANALATGLALYVLITGLGPISGAHFNPIVSIVACIGQAITPRRALAYALAQWSGAVAGVWLAHLMFDLPILQLGHHARAGMGQFASELAATAGLLLTIAGFARHAPSQLGAGVGAYICAAYWFTASTSFANPAVTTARALTDTFAGIAPSSIALFIAAQMAGLGAGLFLARVLFPPSEEDRARR